jgi:hypothetical protein
MRSKKKHAYYGKNQSNRDEGQDAAPHAAHDILL